MKPKADLHEQLGALRAGRVPQEALYGLIHDFGQAGFTAAEPDVRRYLRHDDPDLRYIALNALTFHWDMQKYRTDCERLLFEDPDPKVRAMAAAGLGYILRESRDARATSILLEKLRQQGEEFTARLSAYDALLDLWLTQSQKVSYTNKELDEAEESIRNDRKFIELSEEVDKAKAQGDEERARELSKELDALVQADKRRRESLIDWDLVAAVERGTVPEQ